MTTRVRALSCSDFAEVLDINALNRPAVAALAEAEIARLQSLLSSIAEPFWYIDHGPGRRDSRRSSDVAPSSDQRSDQAQLIGEACARGANRQMPVQLVPLALR
jgi:hypothetical protein